MQAAFEICKPRKRRAPRGADCTAHFGFITRRCGPHAEQSIVEAGTPIQAAVRVLWHYKQRTINSKQLKGVTAKESIR